MSTKKNTHVAAIPEFDQIMQVAKTGLRKPLDMTNSEHEEATTLHHATLQDEEAPDTTIADIRAITPTQTNPEPEEKRKGKKENPTPGTLDYTETFFSPLPRSRKGRQIVIGEDIHEAINLAITASPTKVLLSDFVVNVLQQHFEQYGPEIRRLIAEKERKNKSKGFF